MNSYFEQMILGASPVELIRLLYQRAIRGVRESREHLAGGRIAERSAAITHVYAVVTELMSSLNPEAAPELTDRLRGLYCYLQGRLLEANLEQTDAPLAEVLALLTTLSEAWQSEPVHPNPAPAWIPAGTEGTAERVAFSA